MQEHEPSPVPAPITLAVVGAGARASIYARVATANPGVRVVAVADPSPERRRRMAEDYDIPLENQFESYEKLAATERLADAVIIGTQDALHRDPAITLADRGYHILLEKPMALLEEDAVAIVEAAERNDVTMMVCHVMRYMPLTKRIKQLLDAGAVGEIVSVDHVEPIGPWLFQHSYIRGPWGNEGRATSALMSKSCHDLDWLSYVIGRRALRTSSFGSLYEFRPNRKPAQSTERCLDCPLRDTCTYSATRFYYPIVDDPDTELSDFVWHLTEDNTRAGVDLALRNGPYGLCVWNSDNDVVDHQVVNIEYEDQITVTFTMTAFGPSDAGRMTRIFGTKGYMDVSYSTITLRDFSSGETSTETVTVEVSEDLRDASGHGGGDGGVIDAFLRALRSPGSAENLTDARTSLMSHRIVWAAEESRLTGKIVDVKY